MTRVRLRRTGAVLHLIGDPPSVAGDRFRASKSPLPVVAREPGCTAIQLPDGAAIMCSRGGVARRAAPVLDYKFDPSLHELLS